MCYSTLLWYASLPGLTDDISIEFEIRPTFAVLWFKTYSTYHNEILHTSRQCNCRGVRKISLWSVGHIINQRPPNVDRISNSIEISLLGRVPGLIDRCMDFSMKISLQIFLTLIHRFRVYLLFVYNISDFII